METIEFKAVPSKVQTLADGGLRFTFDVGEHEIVAAAQLMECKRAGVVLTVKLTPIEKPDPADGDYWDD